MKFGLALPYNIVRTIADDARLAEENGWDGIFLGDAIWCEDPMISLAAAAMTTHRIRLGTLIIPVPLRNVWKIANDSLALDHLSGGRLTLGLGAGAVWMGWRSYPDVSMDPVIRAELLDETIDILTLLNRHQPFDYDGKHYHIKMTLTEEEHFAPRPVQQPRIPLWTPVLWPRKKSMRRALRCDGLIAEKIRPDGKPEEVTPQDVREMNAFVAANRTLTTPFDIVVIGMTKDLTDDQRKEKILPLMEAGATWWVEGMWDQGEAAVLERIRQGPPIMK